MINKLKICIYSLKYHQHLIILLSFLYKIKIFTNQHWSWKNTLIFLRSNNLNTFYASATDIITLDNYKFQSKITFSGFIEYKRSLRNIVRTSIIEEYIKAVEECVENFI
jgi:hypothetical protein